MIDLGDELAGYGEPYNDGGLVPDDGYIPNGGHRRLADLQKTGFNVPPSGHSFVPPPPPLDLTPLHIPVKLRPYDAAASQLAQQIQADLDWYRGDDPPAQNDPST